MIQNYGSGSRMPINYGSTGSGSATLVLFYLTYRVPNPQHCLGEEFFAIIIFTWDL